MDESGTHNSASVLAVSAYIAKGSVWQAWTKTWNVRKKPIKVFHATDCQNFRGEFTGWDSTKRDAYVAKLLETITKHIIIGIVIGIQMDDFRKAMEDRPDLLRYFGTPFGACFQWAVHTVLETADNFGSQQRMAFIQEENGYAKESREAFEHLKKHYNKAGRKISLEFGSKSSHVPLQAADVLAFEGAKFLRTADARPRRAWTALDPEKKRLRALRYGKDNMHYLISKLEKVAAQERR